MQVPAEKPVLYCVDVRVEAAAASAWRQWMASRHIPEVVATGCFASAFFTLAGADGDAELYTMIYVAPRAADLERYRAVFAPALQADHLQHFGAHVTTTRRELEVIALYNAGAPRG
jgi:hypothetical protein